MKYALIIMLFLSSLLNADTEDKNNSIDSKLINKIKEEIGEGKFNNIDKSKKNMTIQKKRIGDKLSKTMSKEDIELMKSLMRKEIEKNQKEKYNLLLKKFEVSSNKKIKDKESAKSLIITNKTRARLPEPYRSIMVGNYVAVFAHYKEPQMKDSANPVEFEVKVNKDNAESRRLIDEMNSPINDPGMEAKRLVTNDQRRNSAFNKDSSLNFVNKDIRLYIGGQFNGWKVKRLTTHFVVFENILDKRTVKKYF